ncbi:MULTISPECIES: 16S rRNA (guanine(966)-N(2))-methyltransferase RsmD [Herpetosiphon]|uniref:Methyltransferase n=1 Tax=Herpetosiphon geysericola TaxID=70996 RepID=A0A0P6XBL9_9CHLR|nr:MULTISPECIES: 16S rRNA (guanine(966)-N(2))-methyltransferase RsmD [Herpetosiphon]KPL80155.1 methyltransferase [Herpetosiphon geysericola]MBM7843643.1 16S rRNA (guanine(966)-N(2))-methyltransferase RsmD [Herpetosiphon giganteus]
MRVITGSAKGRQLKGPPDIGTRPMLDRVKESLFAILEGFDAFEGRALDLFAGTGSLGIECLSRGAEWADFVEARSHVAAVTKDNLKTTKLAERAKVWNISVDKFLQIIDEKTKYAIILLDPPYAMEGIPDLVVRVAERGILDPNGVLVLGHWPKLVMPPQLGPLSLLKHRRIGDSCFSMYELSPALPPQSE